MKAYQKLFEPIRIGTMEMKNRFLLPAMLTSYCEMDGSVNERFIAYHRARARGGVGLNITEITFVHPSGKGFPCELGIHKDELIPGLKRLADAVHAEGGKIAAQLYHSGRQTYEMITGMPLLAPSAIPCPVCGGQPLEMTKEHIQELVNAYGEGARRAREAGFDAVEVHGAHGYLLGQFLSPYSNQRTDEYGGSLANRARFQLEILKRIRERVGRDFPVQYRLSAMEYVPGGLTLEDTMPFAQMLVENGIDSISVSGGVYESGHMVIPPAFIPHGIYVENAAAIKKAISSRVPVVVAGRLKDPDLMEAIITEGKADIIAIGRTLLADEAFPAKLAAGNLSDIRKCIACNQGCAGRLMRGLDIGCTGNALCGKEWQYDLERKAPQKKKVLVAGGGPGGMEAARVAALRGHEVSLYEKGAKLGGLMNYTVVVPLKNEFEDLRSFLVGQVGKLGVQVKTGQAVDGNVIDQVKPDVVVMATGARPIVPDIPGLGSAAVKTAEEILSGAAAGKNVIVIGGGAVGCETAEVLADRGAKVTVIEMLEDLASDMEVPEKFALMQRLGGKGVAFLTKTVVKEVKPGGEVVLQKDYQPEVLSGVETIVLAVGYVPAIELEAVLKEKNVPYVKIGDCVEARKAIDAIWEGFFKAYEL